MNALNLPKGWTIHLEPEGSIHFARLLDEAGRFQQWVPRADNPNGRRFRRLRMVLREGSADVALPDDVLRLLWGRANWIEGDVVEVLAAFARALTMPKDRSSRG